MSDFELPNLMQVRAFVRVADLGSVSRASEALFRAQSVVTRAISELEARLDAPLFERHANGSTLWVHAGPWGTYREAREARNERLAEDLRRWDEEHERIKELVRTMQAGEPQCSCGV